MQGDKLINTEDITWPLTRERYFQQETAKSGHLLQNACHRNVMKGEIILIFSVRKSQNSNKEEKNSITPPSSHLEAICE